MKKIEKEVLMLTTGNENPRNGDYKSFVDNCYYIEDDLTNSYCYPAVIEVKGGFLVAYYHSNGSDVCLNATKITKISFDEFDIE